MLLLHRRGIHRCDARCYPPSLRVHRVPRLGCGHGCGGTPPQKPPRLFLTQRRRGAQEEGLLLYRNRRYRMECFKRLFRSPPPPKISPEEALQMAFAESQRQGWIWKEPIDVDSVGCRTYSNWWILCPSNVARCRTNLCDFINDYVSCWSSCCVVDSSVMGVEGSVSMF